ncbi:MAG: 23S rRNA (adenine(2503)-C(2))-methyltransferase RlmN [Bacteroidales bacterium]|nr:23S rRNA (adenine(2503)-C(2))-methyltransferase RlmN [Bacteroidales bacterium]
MVEPTKCNLFGSTFAEIQDLCSSLGFPRFSAKQICQWLYGKNVSDIQSMTNLSLLQRSRLSEVATIEKMQPVDCQISCDGTKKYLFAAHNGYVETVYIPDGDRATLCISCQVGCRMGCHFCVTGSQGFHGNLSAAEILSQLFSIPEFSSISNIVYMGMGEPMDNYDNVLQSLQVITSDWGLAWSPHRITVSSVGIIPAVERLIADSQCHIAISLHNPFPDERQSIMPMQKAYPIAQLVEMLKKYDWSGQRRVSFEYTMFDGLNDSTRHAQALVKLLNGLLCRVNLIRFHSSPDTPFRTAKKQTMENFRDYLNDHSLRCTIRASRGEDIMAACGLLAGKSNSDNL